MQQLNDIRATFYELEDRVHIAILTQLGDAYRLQKQRDEVLKLAAAASQV